MSMTRDEANRDANFAVGQMRLCVQRIGDSQREIAELTRLITIERSRIRAAEKLHATRQAQFAKAQAFLRDN